MTNSGGIELRLALLQVPVGPHRLVARRRRRRAGGRRAGRAGRASPTAAATHGPTAITTCSTSIVARARRDARDRAGAVALEAGDLDAFGDLRARGARLVGQSEHRLLVEREAAAVLVQADGQAVRAPVGVERAHVRGDLRLAGDQRRVVADPLVALVHLDEVGLLRGGPSAM